MGGNVNLIEECIGIEAYSKLCGWIGGIDYYVPADRQSSSALVLASVIGEPEADKLVAWAGGSRIYVSSAEYDDIERRRTDVVEMRRRGMTIREIAGKYQFLARYTERQIYRMLCEKS